MIMISEVRKGTGKPVIIYPNSGERYDASKGSWVAGSEQINLAEACKEWVHLGAACIGGCCRIGPTEIAGIRANLIG